MINDYVKSLADLIERQFSIRTTSRINPVADEVDIAVTQVLASNPKRVGLLILNLSANTIYIAPDENVSAARGILLAANGGSVSMKWDHDFEVVSLPWYGSATANNSDVFVLEEVIF
jgi:hypothetical protein